MSYCEHLRLLEAEELGRRWAEEAICKIKKAIARVGRASKKPKVRRGHRR